jgi:hypothetical protein
MLFVQSYYGPGGRGAGYGVQAHSLKVKGRYLGHIHTSCNENVQVRGWELSGKTQDSSLIVLGIQQVIMGAADSSLGVQEQADTMKMQLDAQRKALDNLLGNTKCGPRPVFSSGTTLGTPQGSGKVVEGSIVKGYHLL